MSNLLNIDLSQEIIIGESEAELNEQKEAREMLKDLADYSHSDDGKILMSTWELNFIDDVEFKKDFFTKKQIELIDKLHTKYCVREGR